MQIDSVVQFRRGQVNHNSIICHVNLKRLLIKKSVTSSKLAIWCAPLPELLLIRKILDFSVREVRESMSGRENNLTEVVSLLFEAVPELLSTVCLFTIYFEACLCACVRILPTYLRADSYACFCSTDSFTMISEAQNLEIKSRPNPKKHMPMRKRRNIIFDVWTGSTMLLP